MTIHIQQLEAPLNREFVDELINLWNDNTLETADCALDDQDREMIHQQTGTICSIRIRSGFCRRE
nr:hypothetical protein [Bacillus licheniformis]